MLLKNYLTEKTLYFKTLGHIASLAIFLDVRRFILALDLIGSKSPCLEMFKVLSMRPVRLNGIP